MNDGHNGHGVGAHDFVVVANRLPVDLLNNADGTTEWKASPGGLVSALSPILESRQGCWVGWPGVADASPEPFYNDAGALLHPVTLSEYDYEAFYEGFSNATLWPLYHDLIVPPTYHREWWTAYREVNTRFAEHAAAVAAPGATVWVQDYQLQLVPGILRQLRPDVRIGFFAHIPFPHPDIFRQLPWRHEIIRGLLGADVVGFQLTTDANHFLQLVAAGYGVSNHDARDSLESTPQGPGFSALGTASLREITARITTPDAREVGVAAFPISLDSAAQLEFTDADAAEIARLRADLGNPQVVFLGVDRLDYTKGIVERLQAFEELLEAGVLHPREVSFVQLATPSRERIEHYRKTRSVVEETVGRINGRFSTFGHPVVHYQHTSVPKQTLRRYYRLADVMVVTPFKDGMNLVAKEYVACHNDGTGALVLSEFAGAANELPQAVLCNPFDMESIKTAMVTAVAGLREHPERMRDRMQHMHAHVLEYDVARWAQSFLSNLDRFSSDELNPSKFTPGSGERP